MTCSSRPEEFDYPRGEDNVLTTYQGNGGVPRSGMLRRLMFAIRFRSTDTSFSPNLTEESRVMMYRRIAQRASYEPSYVATPSVVSRLRPS